MQLPNYGSWRRAQLRYVDEALRFVPRVTLRVTKTTVNVTCCDKGKRKPKGLVKNTNVATMVRLRLHYAPPSPLNYLAVLFPPIVVILGVSASPLSEVPVGCLNPCPVDHS